MWDILLSGALKGAKYLAGPVGRHCGYVCCADRKVRQLNRELRGLDYTSQRVQHSVKEARDNMKPIHADVEKWVEDEQIVSNTARSVLDYNGRAQKSCFYGWLPNPKVRYCLGKDASKMVKEIQQLTEQRNPSERVYYENDAPGLVKGTPDVNSSAGGGDDNIQENIARDQSENPLPRLVGGAPDLNSSATHGGDNITDSRASIFQDIMEALDDEKMNVIGIYGPGGVGKTTLLEKVEEKLRKGGRPFHMIVRAKVSQNQDLTKIQYDIAYALRLNLKDEPSEEGKKDLLSKRLQRDPNEKILIILDDLWDKLDLKAIGIPSGEGSKGCKLLLTSRYNNVLLEKMHADRTFHLKGLEDGEAVTLFEETVGDRLKDEEELKPIAAQVATKLAGLPLLIISVATALKNSDVGAWRNASKNIDAEEMETIVQLSYDHLKGDDTKSLFLLCGLIGGTIQVEILLVLGMGLGLFEKYRRTIQGSRDRLDAMLSELRSACLLLDGGDDKENVTIHDLYSEVVVSTPFRDQNSLIIHDDSGTWPKEKLDECRACLVDVVGNDRFVELMPHRFPQAKILMLSGKTDMGDCSRTYFKDMKELRALCLCSRSITSLPSPIEILGNLQSLIINCHVKDEAILGELKALEILSVAGYAIARLPKDIGKLTNLRSLNIGYTDWLTIESGALEGLINLEELHMKGRHHQWMKEDETPSSWYGARLPELKSLTKLTSLEIHMSVPSILLDDDDLPVENLIRFSINNDTASGRDFKDLSSIKLHLYECGNVLSREWVQKILQKTQYLYLSSLSEFKVSAHELCTRGFRELKHLDIDDSSSIEYIANPSSGLRLTAFTKLESLFLKNLTNLEKICNGAVAPECFSKLKAVSIKNCDRLKYLWRLSEIRRLAQLEEIEVWGCKSMRALIRDDAGEDIADADHTAELPNVRRLRLGCLPNMTSFCAETEIPSEGIPIQVSFPCLESLEMRDFQSASSILKSDWILMLANLESLDISGCELAEVVFDLGELQVAGDVEILPRLTKMRLSDLGNLQRIWKQDVQLQGISIFQNLKELFVSDTTLPFLFPASVAKCLRQIRDIQLENCFAMRAIIMDEEGRDEGTNDLIEFPLLKRLSIIQCPIEKFFSYTRGKKESITATSDLQDANSESFFDQKVSLPCLEELVLRSAGPFTKIWHGELPGSSFCKLATLTLGGCSNVLNVFPPTIIGRLHNLEKVSVEECPSLESLFDLNMEQNIASLPKLEQVWVRKAGSLRHMVKSVSEEVLCFPCLKHVSIVHCSDLSYVFPYFTATTLVKLEGIFICGCENMVEVVLKEERGRSTAEVISFPCLSELTLLGLEKLLSFSSGSCSYDFTSLTKLCIRSCCNFRAFISSSTNVKRPLSEMDKEDDGSPQPLFNEMVRFPNLRELEITSAQCKELWNNPIPTGSFCRLEYLKLEDCQNLQRIAPSHMWKRLQCCLEILDVRSCPLIKIIYETDGTVTKSGKLRSLQLSTLENLRHIWRYDGLPSVPFPNLRSINVWSCPLETLFPTFTAEFIGQIEMLEMRYCENLELIASHGECEEATETTITFSRLTKLRLNNLPKFRRYLPEKYSAEFPPSAELHVRSCGTEPDQGADSPCSDTYYSD